LFGGVVLVDSGSANSELGGFSISHRPGLAVPGEALLRLGAFDTWVELLVPHELRFSSSSGVWLVDSGFFTEESGKLSHGFLYDGGSKKRTHHNGRFQLSLPVGSAEIVPSVGTFRRSWRRRWVRSWFINTDSE
jgi:hypothetical protein